MTTRPAPGFFSRLWILRFFIIFFVLLFQASLASAQSGNILQSAAAKSIPNIDGRIDPSEWKDATQVNKTLDLYSFQGQKMESHPLTLFIKNDGKNLYIAGRLEQEEHDGTMSGSDINSLVMDTFNVAFDNNNDGVLQPGEDKKSLSILNSVPYVKDEHRLTPEEQQQGKDESEEPQNMKGQITHSSAAGGQYQFEMSIPLSSGDPLDVQLQPGGKVRWNLFYFDKFNFTFQGIRFGGWTGLDVENAQDWGYLQLARATGIAPVPAPSVPTSAAQTGRGRDIKIFGLIANEKDLNPKNLAFVGSHYDFVLTSFPFKEATMALKQQNPNLKVFLFTNPYFGFGDKFWNATPSEIEATARQYSLKTNDNKTIFYGGPTYSGMDFEQRLPLMDITNTLWQDYFSSQARKYVDFGNLDGLFLDTMEEDIPPFALAPGNRFPKGYSVSNWKNGNYAFLNKVKQAFQGSKAQIYFNGVTRAPGKHSGMPNQGMLAMMDGTAIESYSIYMSMDKDDPTKRWYFQQTILKDLKKISEQGKGVVIEVYCDRDDESIRLYALASFLLVQNENTYFYFTRKDQAGGMHWRPEWDAPLGSPLGSYKKTSSGIHYRDFSKGKVLVNPSNRTVTLQIPKSYKNWKGHSIGNSLSLPPFSGSLLLKN